MRIPTEMDLKHFPEMFGRFISITGPKPWKKRIGELHREGEHNPFLQRHLMDRHSLVFSMSNLVTHIAKTKDFPKEVPHENYELYSFIVTLANVFERLNEAGQNRLRGRIIDGLNTDVGLSPLQHEFITATHLMRNGYDVVFSDLENGGGNDFLAIKDGYEIEVECKSISADIGRKIPRRHAGLLANEMKSSLESHLRNISGGLLLNTTVPDRLSGNKSLHQEINAQVKSSLENMEGNESNRCAISLQEFKFEESPFNVSGPDLIQEDEVHMFLRHNFGIENREVVIHFSLEKRTAIIAVIQSNKSDKMVQGIYRQLKDDARKQFSGNRPAWLAVQLFDLTPSELINVIHSEKSDLNTTTDIHKASCLLLERRPHVLGIVYLSHSDVTDEQSHINDRIYRVTRGDGPTYVILNSKHPDAEVPSLKVF